MSGREIRSEGAYNLTRTVQLKVESQTVRLAGAGRDVFMHTAPRILPGTNMRETTLKGSASQVSGSSSEQNPESWAQQGNEGGRRCTGTPCSARVGHAAEKALWWG